MFPFQDRPTVKPEHKRQPSNTRIRLKLMPVLIKSREAAVQFPSCIQVQNPPPPLLHSVIHSFPFCLHTKTSPPLPGHPTVVSYCENIISSRSKYFTFILKLRIKWLEVGMGEGGTNGCGPELNGQKVMALSPGGGLGVHYVFLNRFLFLLVLIYRHDNLFTAKNIISVII